MARYFLSIAALIFFFESASAGLPLFFSKKLNPVGDSPVWVATSDFNSDGIPDFAVANQSGHTVSVMLSDGQGAFSGSTEYATGLVPQSVVATDFGSDGFPDLAVTNDNSDNVVVLINAGDGTFDNLTPYPVGGHPRALCSQDFNGDSKADLALFGRISDTVSVLLNNGDGTFALTQTFKPNAPNGIELRGLVSADVDGDGDFDLAAPEMRNDIVIIFQNDGSGTFAQTTSFGSEGTSPSQMTFADFDGDDDVDLVVPNSTSQNAATFLNDAGVFTPSASLSVSFYPITSTTGDFNGDGIMDIAVGGQGEEPNVAVFTGDGNGGFSPAGEYAIGGTARYLASADLDVDGDDDLACATYTISSLALLLNIDADDYICGDCDASFAQPDIADLTCLVNYMFKGQHVPEPLNSIDVDGNQGIDIGDVTHLVGFMFKSGDPPVCQGSQ